MQVDNKTTSTGAGKGGVPLRSSRLNGRRHRLWRRACNCGCDWTTVSIKGKRNWESTKTKRKRKSKTTDGRVPASVANGQNLRGESGSGPALGIGLWMCACAFLDCAWLWRMHRRQRPTSSPKLWGEKAAAICTAIATGDRLVPGIMAPSPVEAVDGGVGTICHVTRVT